MNAVLFETIRGPYLPKQPVHNCVRWLGRCIGFEASCMVILGIVQRCLCTTAFCKDLFYFENVTFVFPMFTTHSLIALLALMEFNKNPSPRSLEKSVDFVAKITFVFLGISLLVSTACWYYTSLPAFIEKIQVFILFSLCTAELTRNYIKKELGDSLLV